MHAVRDVQARIARDAIQVKGHERDALLPRQIPERASEVRRIRGTVVRGRLHPGQQDLDTELLRLSDDRLQVLLHAGNGQTAQSVVGTKLDDENPTVSIERPFQTSQSAG